nr:CoA transferase [Sinorhizobium mexicanum]
MRVVDFGQYMAGPMAAMYLADDGADVIRVEHPAGPLWDIAANAVWNRGKRSIRLDLKTAEGLRVARRLIECADVLIENFRPGVMERLGLGSAEMLRLNPRLIYLCLPGFGRRDDRSGNRAWEGVLGAATGAFRPAERGQPVYTAIPYSSAFGSFLGVAAVAAALFERERSDLGQVIEVPLFDATFTAIGLKGMKIHSHPTEHAAFNWTRQARTADGRWFMYMGSNKRAGAFLKETGLDHRADPAAPDDLAREFDALFATRSAAEWEQICEAIGTEGVTCLISAEWMQHPQARQSGAIITLDDPQLGMVTMPGLHTLLSRTPGSIRGPRPLADQDRESVLAELETMPPPAHDRPKAIPATAAALEGIRVLDLCIILAGPACGRTLAEFGAEVIKIDSPHHDFVKLHNDINRGKRSLLLDLKSPDGMEIFLKLVDRSDVVLQNFRPGVAEALGIDYARVHRRKPDIVYCSLNTYGQVGPYAERPGHEQIAQAVTGMQLRYGGGRPVLAPFAANDYGTGVMAAYAVMLALYHRKRTGEGQLVTSSLIQTATLLQSHLLVDFAGKCWDEPSGQQALGAGALCRAYRCADAWIFLQGRPEEAVKLAELCDAMEDERAMEQVFVTRTAREWCVLLTAAGLGAHEVEFDMDALMEDARVRRFGLSLTREHDGIGPVTTTGPAISLSRSPIRAGEPAPMPGRDGPAILQELGFADRLEDLVTRRVVAIDGVRSI